jgi:SAM-dependent methyltransferase
METEILHRIKRFFKTRQFTRLDDDAYIKAYAQDSDRRISSNPQKGIGGMWDEMGELQFDFLKAQGLLPSHTLLDIGCGTLRGGRMFIPYLEEGHYTGFDVSRRAIDAAEDLCRREGLLFHKPRLLHVPEGRLDFSFLSDRYDFLLAQSVFSHLREPHISECFNNIRNIMTKESRFFFTFYEANSPHVLGYKSFAYSFDSLKQMATDSEFVLSRHPEYAHPRGQVMIEARPAES